MPRVQWALTQGRPCVEVLLTLSLSGQPQRRVLLADSGAGSRTSRVELVLDEDDCLLCGGYPHKPVKLGGAISGVFPTYHLPVRLPALGFAQVLRVVGVPSAPAGLDGIACFKFLNRFTYGNFGDANQFGLEC
jgi:hypothetical protein